MATEPDAVKTRILIISDTHGVAPGPDASAEELEIAFASSPQDPTGYRSPLARADVAIHCGDLTRLSRPSEYRTTFDALRALHAPVKLVIAGNHDTALDGPWWRDEARQDEATRLEIMDIVQDARRDGVRYLTEGTYDIGLENGALLRVYASQYTPMFGGWAFQYEYGHRFDMPAGVDIAVTHGPPQGVLDYAPRTRTHAGCPDLFEAVARARPRVHCFGHIHEGWGGLLARWKGAAEGAERIRAKAIDEAGSTLVKDLRGLFYDSQRREDDREEIEAKRNELVRLSKERGLSVDLTPSGYNATQGEQTLFLNAAIMDIHYRPTQMPWIVDLDLPRVRV